MKKALMCLLFFPVISFGAIRGILKDYTHTPLPGIQVMLLETGERAITDENGHFEFAAEPGPYTLVILDQKIKARFHEDTVLTVHLKTFSQSLEVRPPAMESSNYDRSHFTESSGTGLTDILTKEIDVHQVGISGALSTVSIGGFGKHRVQTLVNGFRIMGDRRAGSDLGTLIPSLLEGASIYRGSTSTTFGSQAIGGVMNVDLPYPNARTRSISANFLYGTGIDRYQADVSYRGPKFLMVAALDDADRYESPDGAKQDGFYTRKNALFSYRLDSDNRMTVLDAFYSEGTDIGKPSTSSKLTIYPENILALMGIRSYGTRISYQAGIIYQRLETVKQEESSEIDSLNIHSTAYYKKNGLQLGVEMYTRQNVDSTVYLTDQTSRPLEGAYCWELAPIFLYTLPVRSDFSFSIGGRYQYFIASNGEDDIDRDFLTGHAYLTWNSTAGDFSLGANRTFRFPTLDELYYSGLTGRGYIEGNPDLSPEKGIGGSLSWSRAFDQVSLEAAFSHQAVDDYVERLETSEDYYTYRNVARVSVYDASLKLSTGWFSAGFSWADGEDRDTGDNIDDIPPLKFSLSADPAFGRFKTHLRLSAVDGQDDYGPNEKHVPGYAVLDLGLTWTASEFFTLSLRANNVLDKGYYPSADEKAVWAPGRSVLLALKFHYDLLN